MADKVSLGRVQGAGFFYTSATCTSTTITISLSSIVPSDVAVFVGDKVLCSTGEVFTVVSVGSSDLMVEYVTSLKGNTGTMEVGTVKTLTPGDDAYVKNVGTSTSGVFDFGIPQGNKGDKGDRSTLEVGTVETLDPGNDVYVKNVGTSTDSIFDFGIPKGEPGTSFTIAYQVDSVDDLPAPIRDLMTEAWAVGKTSPHDIYVVAIDNTGDYYWLNLGHMQGPQGDKGDKGDTGTIDSVSVTTLEPGSDATVENVGTSTSAEFVFGIPRGDKGEIGNTPDVSMSASVDQTIGTATVGVDKGGTVDAPTFALTFSGVKGEKGETGNTPNISVSADVDQTIGTATVGVSKGGDADNPTFALAFSGIKGEKGETGNTPEISMDATIDQTIGTATVGVSKSGSIDAPSFVFAFSGIKGEKGETGDAATINSGTVTALSPDASPTVSNSGDTHNAVFNFGIPQADSVVGASLDENNELTFTLTSGKTLDAGKVIPATSIYVAFIRDTSTGQIAYFGGFYDGVATVNNIKYSLFTETRTVGVCGLEDTSVSSVTIPSAVEIYNITNYGGGSEDGEYAVTSIEGNAFQNYTSLKTVVLPNTITSIEASAFSGCTNLSSITWSTTLATIGNYAFSQCTSLTTVTLPNSVTSIGNNAFYNCSGLTSLSLSSSLTSIGTEAFYNASISSLTLPSSITSFGNECFSGCVNLTNVTYNCENAKMSSSITHRGIFYGTSSRTSPHNLVVTIGSSVRVINSYVFANTYNYVSISFNSGCTEIASYAFYGTESMTDMTLSLPDTLLTIGEYAFSECGSLEELTIPNSVTDVGDYAFYQDMAPLSSSFAPTSIRLSIGSSVSRLGQYCIGSIASAASSYSVSIYFYNPNEFTIDTWAVGRSSSEYTTVYYVGSESDRTEKITISSTGNELLQNCTWVYNYK